MQACFYALKNTAFIYLWKYHWVYFEFSQLVLHSISCIFPVLFDQEIGSVVWMPMSGSCFTNELCSSWLKSHFFFFALTGVSDPAGSQICTSWQLSCHSLCGIATWTGNPFLRKRNIYFLDYELVKYLWNGSLVWSVIGWNYFCW